MNAATLLPVSSGGDLPLTAGRTTELSLPALAAAHAGDAPGTEWITRLPLESARENLRCLPLSLRISKRCVDVVGALTIGLLMTPVMILAAILVKLTSPGPVIYRQTRVGLNLRSSKAADRRQAEQGFSPESSERRRTGQDRREVSSFGRLFTIYKFRTMRVNAEEFGAQFACEGDSRITPVGRILRRTRIDELPQLWNILKGDMSLIGPRPERPEFMAELQQQIPNFIDRLGLRPGMTGIAQVVNGYDNELEGFRRKIAYDLLYLQNCSFRNDVRILLRTVRVVITGEGAI